MHFWVYGSQKSKLLYSKLPESKCSFQRKSNPLCSKRTSSSSYLYSGVRLLSVRGLHSNVWSIATSLLRCVPDWRIRRGTFYPNMAGSIICGSTLHHHRRFYNFSSSYVIRLFIFVLLDLRRLCAS